MATECFCLNIENPKIINETKKQSIINLGEYVVEWRRISESPFGENNENRKIDLEGSEKDSEKPTDIFYVKSKSILPDVEIEPFPFHIEAKLPPYGMLDQELNIVYVIKNNSISKAIELECMLDENDYFSISGKKLVNKLNRLYINPHQKINS